MKKKRDSYTIELSHQDKLLFPASGITKGDVIEYYKKIAPFFIPHAREHCVVMQRFPNGINEEPFYQKEIPDYFPDWINRKAVTLKSGDKQTLVLIEKKEDLIYLANQAVLTPHLWLSNSDKPHFPTKIVFDLDPMIKDLTLLYDAAFQIKAILESYGLVPFVMTTGSRGYHVAAAIKPDHDFEIIHAFARTIAHQLAEDNPDCFTIHMSKAERGNRVFIDYLRNGFGQTSVAPYAIRAHEGAPVAIPIEWDELTKTPPQKYTIKNIFRRLARKGDIWADFERNAKKLVLKKE